MTSVAASRPGGPTRDTLTDAQNVYKNSFAHRHLGSGPADIQKMLGQLGCPDLATLTDEIVPASIRLPQPLAVCEPATEEQALAELKTIADENRILRSMIGMGYYDTITPAVILRNLFENPLWYTPYTPYQAEIAQGRLEALLNFQTMVSDLTALEIANASLLDEATAAAEAMAMAWSIAQRKRTTFLVATDCHPQTIAVVRTRGHSMGVGIELFDPQIQPGFNEDVCGILLQYPTTDGRIEDYRAIAKAAHDAGAVVVVATDLLALTLLSPPGEWGADIAVGSSQRFGVPMGYGGPHAAFLATRAVHARRMPGRLVGVSVDSEGRRALRLAIQTREQHIKRDKATSNICTAQVLLAVAAGMYALWHGPQGLRCIAQQVRDNALRLRAALKQAGFDVQPGPVFDTLCVREVDADAVCAQAVQAGINLRRLDAQRVGIACDQTTTDADLAGVLAAFGQAASRRVDPATLHAAADEALPQALQRTSDYLSHEVFNRYHSEHELLRYMTRLVSRDVSLAQSMIPLGSCTMKLNAAAEMIPITWPAFARLHPFVPAAQARGYQRMLSDLEDWLAQATGFAAVSLQPNAGSQGEYAGLLAIAGYHRARGDHQRDICLIPTSAHGTNPASAVIAGMKVVAVACDAHGNIDLEDLKRRAAEHADRLAAIMITYPSTHGVFETHVRQVCQTIHEHGGQVYMDGANMNAQVGLTSPGHIGADVCHLNLHKTFCIPHGGGGPGMGPIAVAAHLKDHLPDLNTTGQPLTLDPTCVPAPVVSAAPYGSAMILPIPWMYIRMMGGAGLTRATQIAMLNANYMARRLEDDYHVLYRGQNARVAHEFILDCRPFEKSTGVKVEDIAKRLMDFGFHAPTMSFPVAGTLMIEPTESESLEELDRFCDAMIQIRQEIAAIEAGGVSVDQSPLRHAPHSIHHVTADQWPHAYSRSEAAYPLDWVRDRKFWPTVGRIDNVHGDRNLICTCPSVEDLADHA